MVWQPANQVPEQDRQKYEKEFDEYYKELETAREKWVIFSLFSGVIILFGQRKLKKVEQLKESVNGIERKIRSFRIKKKKCYLLLSKKKKLKVKIKKNWGCQLGEKR